jgi:hypothetical protein
MEPSPQFNFRDVLWAPARALQGKQILVMTLFLLLALAVYDIFTYLSYLADGEALGTVFNAYGLLPFEDLSFTSVIAWIVFAAGLVLSILAVMLGFLAVAAINIEAVRGNRFMSAGNAISFAFSRFGQLFLSELAIGLFVLLLVVLFAVLGLISRIPLVGHWIYTLVFVLPTFVVALFAVFVIFVFTLTVLLLPAVAAGERRGETFSTILETFSTIIRQPFRWAGYTLYALVAAKVCSFIYAYFCFRAVEFTVWASAIGGGSGLNRLVKGSLSHLPVRSGLVRETFNIFPGISFGVGITDFFVRGSESVLSHLMAFMLFLIFASILGYALAVIAAGQARGYVAIRYIKDHYSIADEDPMFFVDEHVNPPIEPEEEPPTGPEAAG